MWLVQCGQCDVVSAMWLVQYLRSNVRGGLCTNQLDRLAGRTSWMDQLDGPAGRTSQTDQLDRPTGRTSWTNQLNRPAERTSQTYLLDRSAGRTSSFYLKPWPVRIFEDFPFSLYIVAASESDEGLVFIIFGNIFLLQCLDHLEGKDLKRVVFRLLGTLSNVLK